MKKTLSTVLSLSISFQLAFGTVLTSQALAQDKNAAKETTGTAANIEAVIEEGNALFGEGGPAFLDEKTGKIYIRHNSTTSSALHDDESQKNSLDTMAQISAFAKRAKKAQDDFAKLSDDQKAQINKSCASCGVNVVDPLSHEDNQIPADGLCSKADKNKIAAEVASRQKMKPAQCTIWGEIQSGKTSCWDSLKSTFMSSLGTMAKSAWNLGIGVGKHSAKEKLFDSYKPVEKASTDTGLLLAGISEKDRELARKNVESANSSILSKLGDFASWVGQWVLNLDVPMYKELMQCAKCGDRANAICKIAAVVGKDVLQNMAMMYLGGKGIQMIAEYGEKRFVQNGAMKAFKAKAAKTLIGRTAVEWGSRMASVSLRASAAYTNWIETGVGKAVNALVKGGMKIVNVASDLANGQFKAAAKQLIPSKIIVGGGEKVAEHVAAQKARAEIFEHTPGLEGKAGKVGETAGLSTLNDVASTASTLEVEVARPMTREVQQSKKLIAKSKKPGLAADFTNDIENATASDVVKSVNNKSIKVQTPNGEKYVNVAGVAEKDIQNGSVKYYHFGENSEKGILEVGKERYYVQDGKTVKVPAHERPSLEKITSRTEQQKANQIAVDNAKANIQANGGKVEELNASVKEDGSFKTKTPEGCAPENVTIVGKAI